MKNPIIIDVLFYQRDLQGTNLVREFRRIKPNRQELILALEAHNRMTLDFPPVGKILELIGLGDAIEIKMSVMSDDYDLVATMTRRGNRLLIPIIRYCVENNVTLPRAGTKPIDIEEDGLSLCIAIDTEMDFAYAEPAILSRYGTQ
jgi:hypothetical protein